MQPYFFPYIGYFQLIAASDQLVVYDNIKYTKKGWINRNRFLLNGKDTIFTIPLKKDSDILDVRDRRISPEFQRGKLVEQLKAAYLRAPQFDNVFPQIAKIIGYGSDNLFEYVSHSIQCLCNLLEIETQFIVSSQVPIDHNLRNQDKLLALCSELAASHYLNPIGGAELYSREQFNVAGIKLNFIKTKPIKYTQFGNVFIPNLSIIDVLMFNTLDQVKHMIRLDYELM